MIAALDERARSDCRRSRERASRRYSRLGARSVAAATPGGPARRRAAVRARPSPASPRARHRSTTRPCRARDAMSPLSSQCAVNRAATVSPVPLGMISKPINGVTMRQAASGVTASISICSASASARRRLVTSASRGPFSRLRVGGERLVERLDLAAGQMLQLEMVGRDQVGRRQGAVPEEGVDARLHVDAGVDVAQHRIAAPDRLGIGRAHLARGVEHDVAQGGVADIAGEQRVALSRARPAPRCRARCRRPVRPARCGRARRRSRCGSRTRPCSPPRPHGPIVAGERSLPDCRRSRRRHGSEARGSAWPRSPCHKDAPSL